MKGVEETQDEMIARLRARSAEQDAEIERLLKSISEKTARIEELEKKKRIYEILRENAMKNLHK